MYKPLCEKGFDYDVNSLYPLASKNPMPGNKVDYIEDLTGQGLNLDGLFGFFHCFPCLAWEARPGRFLG